MQFGFLTFRPSTASLFNFILIRDYNQLENLWMLSDLMFNVVIYLINVFEKYSQRITYKN